MNVDDKILQLDSLAERLEQHRQHGQTVVLCHGCFDLLHIGHIRHFRQARELGDILVVTVSPDEFVDKRPGGPAFDQSLRTEALASLGYVDYVAVNKWPTAVELLNALKPNFYVKGSEFKEIGSDYTGKIEEERRVAEELGTELFFTEDIVFSSSNLINRFFSGQPEEVREYLQLFRKRYSKDDILGLIDDMAGLKVLVIGDTILDDYHYAEGLGKSNKDPVLALKHQSNDLFAGGVLAVANHVASFAGEVTLFSVLGDRDRYEEFIRDSLNPKVTARFVTQPDSPTVLKRRFIDSGSLNKLLEIYHIGEATLAEEPDASLLAMVEEVIGDHDLVIAADFGHGAVSDAMVELLAAKAPYLAVNTQANAGNRGFHTISRYPHADFACLAEHEIRLDYRDMISPLRPMMEDVAKRLDAGRVVVTRGDKGTLVHGGKNAFVACPAFVAKSVDRVGAGDALFSVAALAACRGADEEQIGFIGNIVGSQAVTVIGNQKAVDKRSVEKTITTFMK
ncbi:adenylyltransferase/cytidyltransferase family protein [Pseudodesulfovibrio cashew]|uniref:Adenylyltransferase/cytidyltransferase family protein n=1 Tax=Pseudodesulfovibrio cashew TaxID=2678688 RepID=A0A6I6JDX1_9BACT|nr:PfkB family carbohydrate kinase [Pseudodesulfovibrio cashew]QGY39369.1 adenylyltransferase/cytidyltransferase family protein [Pseudodesulfovibrio cashew]